MSQADLTRNVGRVRAGESDAWGQLYEELAPSVFPSVPTGPADSPGR